jgi:hypothetical protein
MSGGALYLLMMMEEDERRRREEEEREEREEQERRRRELHRRMVEERKNSPVVYCEYEWQIDRCVKAISMQPSVQKLVELINKAKLEVIEIKENKYDEQLLEAGNRYELVKTSINNDIAELNKLGITIEGNEYVFSRLAESKISKPEKATESFGDTFKILDYQPIELNLKILSTDGYFRNKYNDMKHEEIEQGLTEANSKIEKYKKYGKVFGFLLKTNKYSVLEQARDYLVSQQGLCELRKREMEIFDSLNKEQLLAIKSYFVNLDELRKVSANIEYLFHEKDRLRKEPNEKLYDLVIKYIIAKKEDNELLDQVKDYIENIYANDEKTMKEAYELVKGMYPIDIQDRWIYDLIINNLKSYKKEKSKSLKKGI